MSSISAISAASLLTPSASSALTRRDQTPAQQAHTVATQFEAIMVRQFIGDSVGKMMSGGDSKGGDDTGGGGNQMYSYMLTDALATKISEGGGLGLARVLEKQFTPKGAPRPETKP